jgi:hypothetical protein
VGTEVIFSAVECGLTVSAYAKISSSLAKARKSVLLPGAEPGSDCARSERIQLENHPARLRAADCPQT